MGEDATLYDDYLDACLSGEARPPADVFAAHPEADDELRARITALYEAYVERDRQSLPFERLGDFRLLQRLDAGGMGAVFVAEQESLGRVVALKIMRPEWAGDETAVRRFAREAQAVAQLRHPGIVTVYDASADGDTQYIAMELVPGQLMSDVLAAAARDGEQLPVERVVRWGARLARALEYAHARGIVHRDVKPHNIRITPDDRPMLLDFGIAHDLTGSNQTLTQSFQGSPAYAAPEQIQGDEIDPRTDVYALGVTLYQALTNAAPFEAPTVEGIFHKVLTESPTSPRRIARSVSADLETVVLRAMEKRKDARYETAGAFGDDLEAVLAFRPVKARPPGPLARLGKWARRKPARAVAIASIVLFTLVLGGLAIARGAQERRERLAEASQLKSRAAEIVYEYRIERIFAEKREAELALKQKDVLNRYFTPEEDRALADLSEQVREGRRQREALFHDVLTMLARAERLDPDLEGADLIRAELYVEKWQEASTVRDPLSQAFWRNQAERYDPNGLATAAFSRGGTLIVDVETPGATCWVFGFREQRELVPGGDRRLVPVPHNAEGFEPPAPYGATVLRVVKGAGDVDEGDLILDVLDKKIDETLFVESKDGWQVLESVDGTSIRGPADLEEALTTERMHRFRVNGREHEGRDLASLGYAPRTPAECVHRSRPKATVLTKESVRSIVLPAGLVVRVTAIPLYCVEAARLASGRLDLPTGRYLVVARAAGYEEGRRAAWVQHDVSTRVGVALKPEGSTPAGFVHIIPHQTKYQPFSIMEREVTCGEYLAFLNDPAVRTQITRATRTLVPRSHLGEWQWEHDGERFRLAGDWLPETPVMGVSYDDALAYAAWKSARDGAQYKLPTEDQWNLASGHGPFGRIYAYGNVFAPKWVSSNWARPKARPEPSFRYPVDESPWGVFATSGSAMEWLDAWWNKDTKTERWVAGGAWGYANPALFRSPGGWGSKPQHTSGTYGFRLVIAP